MAIQKSFVVRNGIEVNSNLIFGDIVTDRVGIGTTQPTDTLHVVGGIAATTINLSGVGTIPTVFGDTLNYSTGNIVTGVITSISGSTINYSGIVTGGSFYVGNTEVIDGLRELKNIVSLDATTTATIESAIANAPNTFTDLNVTGISTLNVVKISSDLNVSGISTLGTVQVSSGIVTATSGIVTYYGDGQYLQNILSGVGVATEGGTVGTGATILDFRGAGISTVTVSAGIATINIEGGGGGGAVSIGTEAPSTPTNGDLWYSPDYGRTFVWYDEVALGIGSTAVWVDAAPFNVDLSQLNDVQFNSLVVVNHTDLNTLDVSGISTFNNLAGAVKIGVGTTALLVEGDARITGILTIGTSSITFDGTNNQITIGDALTINSGGISVNGSGINVSGVSTLGDVVSSGIITASSFDGSGASLTSLNASNISSGTLDGSRLPQDMNVSVMSVSGIVTASSFDGSGASLTSLNASNISSGTLNNARLPQSMSVSGIVTASSFDGSGASLTSLNASNISSGTLNNARLPQDITISGTATANTFSGSGASLTSLNASNISSGTVPTARLASGTANSSTYLRGDQTWATITSGITITNDTSTNATRYLTFTSATSGSISAENVSSTKLTFNPSTGTLTVTDINSTSDINLKTNIHTVENALDIASQLHGVSFDWKETGKSSYGVIAQELEEVLPELVGTGEVKSVNYNGLVGVLIEAIKELKKEVEELKNNK